jgi:hypothetical protein
LLIVAFVLTFPSVQTRLAHKLTDFINKEYKTDIQIDKVDLSYLGKIQVKGIYARDPQKDTIIYIENLKTSIIDFERIKMGKPRFNVVSIDDLTFKIKTYKGKTESAFDEFIKKLEGEPTGKPSGFLLTIKQINLKNAHFRLFDLNKQELVIEQFDEINAEVKNFKVDGPQAFGDIRNLSMIDRRGLIAEKMNTDFSYSKTGMQFKNTYLKTPFSEINGDISFQYKEGEISDFNNKVQIVAELKDTDLAMKDLQKFYAEFGKTDVLHLSTTLNGTLNDFTLDNMNLSSDENARLQGNYRFINAFDTEKGFKLDAKIAHSEMDADYLRTLLPNVLGKNLPEQVDRLGHFKVNGRAKINVDELDAFVNAETDLGNFSTDLILSNINDIERSSYDGDIKVKGLKLGSLIGDPMIGDITMDATIIGKGFSLKDLNTKIDAKIYDYRFKGYTYTNIALQGDVNNKKFNGKLQANDPNLKLTFDGIADLSKDNYVFDFETCVEYSNFKKLHLFDRDSFSILKGDIKVDMVGNTLENLQGSIEFRSANYINEHQDYFFEDFTIISKLEDGIQHLDINSTDIVNGTIHGKFKYAELPKLALNAFGSIYANYKPNKVSPGQFLDFKFNIYNQAVAVFLPDIKLSENTFIRGEIDADDELFKLTFRSPEVDAYDSHFEKIRLQIDNKNPLFNTQLSLANFKNGFYDISDFNMVNVTLNDTLYFQTEFNGGPNLKDKYNLAFYHTIDQNNNSIVTLEDSKIFFNGISWDIIPDKDNHNSLIYNPNSRLITYDNFRFQSNGQTITFFGDQQGENYRNYNIDLDRVQLKQILPKVEDFDMIGLINGGIWIEKRNNMLIPKADVQLIDFMVNGELQGDLVAEIKGGKNNREYLVDMYLEKGFSKNLSANGKMDFNGQNPMIYVVLNFNNFNISPLNALGKGVMENVRGTISGEAGINGKLQNPVFSGDLITEGIGMYFPFINVDYALEENTHLYLQNQSFVLKNAKIFDTTYKTIGTANGNITHRKFTDWSLDMKLETDNLLALNTPETEDALFYGTGYMEGLALFTGDFDNLNITVSGKSRPGTKIIIPMSDIKTVETSRLIHFKNPNKNQILIDENIRKKLSENLKGLTMNFDFDIDKNAEIKIVIDKATGSYLQGTGKGNIIMDIDTKGLFNMYGDYVVNSGIYNFKYGLIINKPFNVKSGGSISFDGNPYKAELDIEAVYTVKANPKTILPEYNSNKNIPVELTTKISGELFNSFQEFDISIPNAGIDLASELDFVLSKQDSGNIIQFVSLLAFGSFINPDKTDYLGTVNSFGNDRISDITATFSNALMEIFSDPDDKIQFGIDYTQGNQNIENFKTENQLGVSFSTKLGKNENIIINGEVNVPTGSQTNANIAGNVSAELPINKKENLFLRMFNRQNEIQYTDEEEGYTQGIGVLWNYDFDKVDLKKKRKKEKNNVQNKDSIINKETTVKKMK